MTRILFITNHLQYSDGVANSLLNLTNNLDKDKYDISICVSFKYDEEFAKKFDPSIKIHKLFNGYFKGLHKLTRFIPQCFLKNRVFNGQKYDIIVGYQKGFPTEFVSKVKTESKKIAYMHGFDDTSINLHRKFHKIICVAEESERKYKTLVDFPERITSCHNVIDCKKIGTLSEASGSGDPSLLELKRPVFCFVGRLSPEKGVERTLKSLGEIKGINNNFSFVIIGEGSSRESIEDVISTYGLAENVKMLGLQKNPYQFLKQCDCYVCSSYGEGLSTSCIEASILHKPIISTKVYGADEIVKNPDVGIVVEDDKALYEALLNVVENKTILDKYKCNFIEANKKWDVRNIVQKFDVIIEEVLK